MKYEQILKSKVQEFEDRGFHIHFYTPMLVILSKESSRFFRSRQSQCLVAIDYQGRLFGQEDMEDPESRWGERGSW